MTKNETHANAVACNAASENTNTETILTITVENKWAYNGPPVFGSMIDKYLEPGIPLSLAKLQHNLACHV